MSELVSSRTSRAAVALRLAGASYLEIADTLGYADDAEARNAVERDLAAMSVRDVEGRDRLRAEEAARLERLLRSVWSKAVDANNAEHLSAARTALAIVDRHAKLLGLDVPSEVIVHNPTTIEIDRWVADRVIEMQDQLPVVEAEVVYD